jgi:hypothetical protein
MIKTSKGATTTTTLIRPRIIESRNNTMQLEKLQIYQNIKSSRGIGGGNTGNNINNNHFI